MAESYDGIRGWASRDMGDTDGGGLMRDISITRYIKVDRSAGLSSSHSSPLQLYNFTQPPNHQPTQDDVLCSLRPGLCPRSVCRPHLQEARLQLDHVFRSHRHPDLAVRLDPREPREQVLVSRFAVPDIALANPPAPTLLRNSLRRTSPLPVTRTGSEDVLPKSPNTRSPTSPSLLALLETLPSSRASTSSRTPTLPRSSPSPTSSRTSVSPLTSVPPTPSLTRPTSPSPAPS